MGVILVASVFLTVVFSYICTEYLLVRLRARNSVISGHGSPLLILLGANAISFILLWVSAMIFVFASGTAVYAEATAVCAVAQALWLTQNLWSYYLNHPRLRYKN